MIIECVNCKKKFQVDSDLIPNDGRVIQCGSCNHTWFFNKNDQFKPNNTITDTKQEIETIKKEPKSQKNIDLEIEIEPKTKINNSNTIRPKIEPQNQSGFSMSSLLSYIVVFLISLVALVIIIDTFRTPIFESFPNLEFALYSLFEIFRDIQLFIKDLI